MPGYKQDKYINNAYGIQIGFNEKNREGRYHISGMYPRAPQKKVTSHKDLKEVAVESRGTGNSKCAGLRVGACLFQEKHGD